MCFNFNRLFNHSKVSRFSEATSVHRHRKFSKLEYFLVGLTFFAGVWGGGVGVLDGFKGGWEDIAQNIFLQKMLEFYHSLEHCCDNPYKSLDKS